MTHPFDVVEATSATYSRKTRIEKVSLPRSTHPNPTQSTRGKSFTLRASQICCSPQIRVWVGGIDRFKNTPQKSTNVLVQCNVRPRFFWFDGFHIIKNMHFFVKVSFFNFSPPTCLVYGVLPVSKHPQQKAREYIYISSQNTRFAGSCPPWPEYTRPFTTYKQFLVFVKHDKLLAFCILV